jgi:hypothetical protein
MTFIKANDIIKKDDVTVHDPIIVRSGVLIIPSYYFQHPSRSLLPSVKKEEENTVLN